MESTAVDSYTARLTRPRRSLPPPICSALQQPGEGPALVAIELGPPEDLIGGRCLRHAPEIPLLDVGTGEYESMTEALPALVQRGAEAAMTSMFNSAVRGTDPQGQVASMPTVGQ